MNDDQQQLFNMQELDMLDVFQGGKKGSISVRISKRPSNNRPIYVQKQIIVPKPEPKIVNPPVVEENFKSPKVSSLYRGIEE